MTPPPPQGVHPAPPEELRPAPDAATLRTWRHHWQDEFDAAYLYLVLAGQEADPKRKDVYIKLAGVEERHTQMWEHLLREHGDPVGARRPRPSLNARLRAWFGRRFGARYLLPLLLREEGQEVKGYMTLHQESRLDDARAMSLRLARESAAHAETLADLAGKASEPWHKTGSGGFLRNVVYGFNDGLTANFGLVAGVIGADVSPHIVLLSGLAGSIADALSMGASGFLAAKSEEEVNAHEIAMEKDEIQMMPDVEEEELALVYQTKGLEAGIARQMAAEVMRDSQRALAEQVREELKIGEAHATPFKEGWVTGVATAVGAFIPVAPFLALSGRAAVWVAFSIAMLSHFAVGAARSFFTGRGVIRSGVDMFVVGLGVAAVGYVVGTAIAKLP
ncbi:MAG TPA: VIT1/CCC1 transporter family protein [Gemmatimonadales bacterium]|nr:VIT1/CCC1 transporter family protein [Gemmatimonadales bacterium]